MQKTGGTIQGIAILVGMIGILGILFTAGVLTDSIYSSSARSSVWITALIVVVYHFISCTLLYAVGKILEGIGDMKDSIDNMSRGNQVVTTPNKKEKEEKLPTL